MINVDMKHCRTRTGPDWYDISASLVMAAIFFLMGYLAGIR